jgi:hypothetical protein
VSSFLKVNPSIFLLSSSKFHFHCCDSDFPSFFSLFFLKVHGHVYYPVFVFHFARRRILIHTFLFAHDQASVILTRQDCKQLPGSSNNEESVHQDYPPQFVKAGLHHANESEITRMSELPRTLFRCPVTRMYFKEGSAKFHDVPTSLKAVDS